MEAPFDVSTSRIMLIETTAPEGMMADDGCCGVAAATHQTLEALLLVLG
jgi:hypothetical protein